jgi:hypothetical protein
VTDSTPPAVTPVAVLCGSVTRAVAALDAAEAYYRGLGFDVRKPVRDDSVPMAEHVARHNALIDACDPFRDVVVICSPADQPLGKHTTRELDRAIDGGKRVEHWRSEVTPESFPSPVGAEDTSSLRERIAAAIAAEDLRMDARSRREPDYDGVEARTEAVMREVESAHGDLVVRNAVLRSERDALARDVERLAERRVVLQRDCARAWDALYPVVRWPVDQTVHSGLPGVAQRAADEIRDLRAELARVSGAHTIPDDARAQLWSYLSGWLSAALDRPFGSMNDLAEQLADSLLSDVLPEWLPAPATDPAPATPDGPSAEWRAGWAAACRALDRFAAERMDAADDLDDMPVADAYGAVTVRAQHWMHNPERAPVAPQVPAEPTERQCGATEGGMGVNCHLPTGHAGWHNARHETGGDVGYPFTIQWPRNQYDHCAPPAGPAVPEDTGTCPECHCAAPIHKTWCKTGDHGDDLNAAFLKPDSHRADTTRPAGEES